MPAFVDSVLIWIVYAGRSEFGESMLGGNHGLQRIPDDCNRIVREKQVAELTH